MAIIFDERGLPITSTNPFPVSVTGSNLAESTQDETDDVAGVHTFSAVVSAIEIVNRDAINELVAVVNGVTLIVPPEVVWGPSIVQGTPSATVTVSGSTTYLLNRYE